MKYLFAFFFVAFASGLAGCQQTDSAPKGPLTASFQLLNEQGQDATVFPQGQNVIFRFEIVNTSDQDVFVKNPVFDTRDFLEVFSTAEKQQVSLGKPYSGIFCYYVGGYVIPAHKAITCTIPWVDATAYPLSFPFCGHAPTTYLPIGHYRTAFSPAVTWNFSGQGPTAATTTNFPAVACEFEVTGR
ncbi:hypothetical protein [Hymenobacter bucti]|uniref:Lipoprotein n=1 Tax=Hymenobacter bucti TaxID=1844114 RepID=A0ABW4R0Y1_9BACT